jgi:serine/threonine-protein kinase BUR1
MLQSSGKRIASTPPPGVDVRPTKRQQRSSSPEEGELDDGDPPQSSHIPSPRPPSASDTPPPTSRYSVKVKLPFKTKVNLKADLEASTGFSNNLKGISAPAAPDYYSVPPERPSKDGWPSGIEVGRRRDNDQVYSRGWKGHPYAHEPSHRDREYCDRRRDRQPSASSQGSPVGDYSRPGRSKFRARSRSRSSSSGSISPLRKQTHRLPPHRSTRGSPSPLLSRRRDETPDSRDPRDRYNNHTHSRYDSTSDWRHDARGHYRREPSENYYAGDYYGSPRPPHRDYYDRGYERDPYESRYDAARSRAMANDYRPVSPRQSSLTRFPRSPSPCPHQTPPQPRSPPPPTPPNPELQGRHPTISFPLPKKPPAPVISCSLSHTSRSPNGEVVRRGDAAVFPPEKNSRTSEKPREVQPPPQPPRPIRPPLHRSREDEYKAYGRTFVGSGQQDDYDTMTKLGEGTFGYVILLAASTWYLWPFQGGS